MRKPKTAEDIRHEIARLADENKIHKELIESNLTIINILTDQLIIMERKEAYDK